MAQPNLAEEEPQPNLAAAVPFAFSLAPGLGDDQPINYRVPEGSKLWKRATTGLIHVFDGATSGLRMFIYLIQCHAATLDWRIRHVPVEGTPVDIFQHHGMVPIEAARAHAATYIDTPSRNAQASLQCYDFLVKSLAPKLLSRVTLHADKFIVNGKPDGICFFKAICMTTQPDTNATATELRRRLQDLTSLIVSKEYNIVEFNEAVQEGLDALGDRGQSTDMDDLRIRLFDAYDVIDDEKFKSVFIHLNNQFNDGTRVLSPKGLMDIAENTYTARVEAGKWNPKDKTQEELLALKAQVEAAHKAATAAQAATKKSNKDTASKRKEKEKKTKGKNGKKDNKKAKKQLAEWKLKAPEGNETTKVVDGDTWNWCKHHERWVFHKSEDCTLGKKDTSSSNGSEKKVTFQKSAADKSKKTAALKALTAIMEEWDE